MLQDASVGCVLKYNMCTICWCRSKTNFSNPDILSPFCDHAESSSSEAAPLYSWFSYCHVDVTTWFFHSGLVTQMLHSLAIAGTF